MKGYQATKPRKSTSTSRERRKTGFPWEEKDLTKSRHYGYYKDPLMGKVTIPKSTDILDHVTDEDKIKI